MEKWFKNYMLKNYVLELLHIMVGWVMTSKYVDIWLPVICEYVTLYSKRNLTDVIKLKLLRWRHYAGLSYNHKGSYKKVELQWRRKWCVGRSRDWPDVARDWPDEPKNQGMPAAFRS